MIVNPSIENIRRAALVLRGEEPVGFPTETVYGLGANAYSSTAVRRVFELKNRPALNPLIVHVSSIADVEMAADMSRLSDLAKLRAKKLMKLWPAALSIVLPKNKEIVSEVTAGLDTVAVRIPNHPVALELLREVGLPIAAPSANQSTAVSPTTAKHVEISFGDKLKLILDGGTCQVGLESTVVSITGDQVWILRPGGVTWEMLKEVLGEDEVVPYKGFAHSNSSLSSGPFASPGMMAKHYSPRTKVVLKSAIETGKFLGKCGLISFTDVAERASELETYSVIKVISQSGDLDEVARNLFASIQALDQLGLDLIVLDTCEEKGIGVAIMDRLIRATNK